MADTATPTPATFVTVEQAAHELALSPRGVRGLIARGDLPAYRLGPRAIRIRRDDLDHFARRIPAGR